MFKKKMKKQYSVNENVCYSTEPYSHIALYLNNVYADSRNVPTSKLKKLCSYLDSEGYERIDENIVFENKNEKTIKSFFSGFFSTIDFMLKLGIVIIAALFTGWLADTYSPYFSLLGLLEIAIVIGICKAAETWEEESKNETYDLITKMSKDLNEMCEELESE